MEKSGANEGMLTEIYRLLASETDTTFRALVERRKAELKISSDNELSKLVGIPLNTLTRLIDIETQKVDLFSILKLCQLLGIEVQQMVQAYVASLTPEYIGELDTMTQGSFVLRNFNRPAMKKMGFIKDQTDLTEITPKLRSFFGLEHINQYASELPAAMFKRVKHYSKDEMRTMWVVAAVAQFKRWTNPHPYDNELLLSFIPNLRRYTQDEDNGLVFAIRALYRLGVTVIVQRYLSNTAVRGASFVIDGRPCIVITDHFLKYPALWVTLIHELYHVLFDYEELKSWRYHLTGDDDLTNNPVKEQEADEFAYERLVSASNLDFIRPLIDTPGLVRRYADKWKVHHSIIYYLHCLNEKAKYGREVFGLYQHFFGSSDKAVKLVKLTPFEQDSVYHGLEAVKEIYEF